MFWWLTLRNNKWEVNMYVHCTPTNILQFWNASIERLFNFKCQVLSEANYNSKIYQLKESALVQYFRIFLRSFIRFSFLALAIATDVQLYLYALSNEQFIRRDISQIISGYRNYQKIRNNKRVLNNTLQHTIRHDKMKDVDIIL